MDNPRAAGLAAFRIEHWSHAGRGRVVGAVDVPGARAALLVYADRLRAAGSAGRVGRVAAGSGEPAVARSVSLAPCRA